MRYTVLALVFAAGLAWPDVSPAQTAKRVYISVDMEGISGISGPDQTSAGQPEYGRSRKLMVEDANAAIRGAFAGGATDVLVNDSHGGQRNLLPEDLDPRARLHPHVLLEDGELRLDAAAFTDVHVLRQAIPCADDVAAQAEAAIAVAAVVSRRLRLHPVEQ